MVPNRNSRSNTINLGAAGVEEAAAGTAAERLNHKQTGSEKENISCFRTLKRQSKLGVYIHFTNNNAVSELINVLISSVPFLTPIFSLTPLQSLDIFSWINIQSSVFKKAIITWVFTSNVKSLCLFQRMVQSTTVCFQSDLCSIKSDMSKARGERRDRERMFGEKRLDVTATLCLGNKSRSWRNLMVPK